MWYAPIGFFISLVVGWIISVILDSFNLGGESKIYTDANRTIINADLFTPPLAKRLRERNAEIMGKNFAVSALLIKLNNFVACYFCLNKIN